MKGGVFALGNFDGVHRGHRLVLDAAVAEARARGLTARALTFEPHPRVYFASGQPPFRLTPPPVKERLLRACGIDEMVTLPFDAALAQLPAQEFVERILVRQFGAQHIVAGHDFAFGKGRGGDMAKLAAWLASYKIDITEIAALNDDGGLLFSSSRIRDCLRAGDAIAASALLGRDWAITGVVQQGAQRGRTIGVPTANIGLGEYLRPQFGVYAVRANKVGDTHIYKGIANIGLRPTVDGTSETMETHLFDFDRDIYGQEWEFALVRFIRAERKFDGLDALKAQIAIDSAEARRILAV